MRTIFRTLLCAFGLVVPITAVAQMTQVTASVLKIGSSTVGTGTVCALAVDSNDNPITVALNGGGLWGAGPSCGVISSGAITALVGGGTFSLPDEAISGNSGFFYDFVITDGTTKQSFSLKRVPNVTGTTWPLDHYYPTTVVSTTPAFTFTAGIGAPSSACSGLSFYQDNTTPGTPILYSCGTDHAFHLVTGSTVGSVTYGTTAGTVAQGNDARIVGSEQQTNKGVASGYAGLDSSAHILATNQAAIVSGDTTRTAGSLAEKVVAIQGIPVSATTPTSGQVLQLVSGQYVPTTPSGGSSLPAGSGLVKVTSGVGGVATAGTDYATPASVTAVATAAEQVANKGANSGYPGLDSSGLLLAVNEPAITTGDATRTAGTLPLTLATVNSNVGACGDATHVSQVTLDAKGRTTACTPVSISAGGSGTVTHATGALTANAPVLGNGTADTKVDTGASSDGAGNWTFASVTVSGGLSDYIELAGATCTVGDIGTGKFCVNGAYLPFYSSNGATPIALITQNTDIDASGHVVGLTHLPSAVTVAQGGTNQTSITSATLTDGATVAFNANSALIASGVLTLVHTTTTRTLNVSGMLAGDYYGIELKQDSTGVAGTFNLGTGCTAWYLLGTGTVTSLTLSSTANAINMLTWFYDGTNCIVNFH